MIRCKANNKVYVGSAAVAFRQRWANHRKTLRRGIHDNGYLQAAWDKHGEAAFEFVIIEECPPEECIAREQYWIDTKRAVQREHGYNLAPNAGSSLGFRHSDEVKEKLAALMRGKKLSAEIRAKMSAAHQNPSPEYRALMSRVKKGEKRSAETRAKIGEAVRRRPPASAETRAKIGAASQLRKHGPETRAKMSKAHKGRKKSAETRARMQTAVKRRWNAIREARIADIPQFPFMQEDAS